ncbi:MAG: hypothetical protein FJ368_03880 [Pelagibacterales bacterium]|nr:hypothetical protein [Pelagibacterales bacterium]
MLNFSSRIATRLSRSNSVFARRLFGTIENTEEKEYSQVLAIRSCPIDRKSSLSGVARIFIPGCKTPPFSQGSKGAISVLPSETKEFFLSNLYSKSDVYESSEEEITAKNFPVSGESIVHQSSKGNPIPDTEISYNGQIIGIFEIKYDPITEEKAKKDELRYFILVNKDEKYYLNEIIDGKEVPAVFSSSIIHFDGRTRTKNEILKQNSIVEENYEHFVEKVAKSLSSFKTSRSDCSMLSSIISDINSVALRKNPQFYEQYIKHFQKLEEEEKSKPKTTVQEEEEKSKPKTTVQIDLERESEKLNKSYKQRYNGSSYNMSAGGD